MSIINRMLQELDRRQGASGPDAAVLQQVRSVPPARAGHEWFWRAIAALMFAAVAWVAWIAWQLQPRPSIATDQAFKAAASAQRKVAAAEPAPRPIAKPPLPASAPQAAPVPASVATVAPSPAAPAAAPAATVAAEGKEANAAAARKAPRPKAGPAARRSPAASEKTAAAGAGNAPSPRPPLEMDVPPARILPAPQPAAGKVEKRNRARSPEMLAESEFRHGAVLLNEGRPDDAEEWFRKALAAYPGHQAARQALVAIVLEKRQVDEARRLLQEGLAINPSNAQFAIVLARIFAGRGDYAQALEALEGAKAQAQAAAGPGYYSLLGSVLQSLGRQSEAAEAFSAALRISPGNPADWVGLGIALEALGKRPGAIESFRRALASGALAADLRKYAEQRLRALQ